MHGLSRKKKLKNKALVPQDVQLILFDCDGTLTDSHGAIAKAMQKAFTDHDFTEPDYQDVLGIIGLSLIAAVERLAPAEMDTQTKQRIGESYASNYRATETSLALYPHVIETLETLSSRGYLMGVVTGKSRGGLVRVLDQFDLHRFFPVWKTADCCHSKPHPAMVLECIDEMGMDAARTVVIGDSRFDIQMANAAGIASLGVSFGVEPADVLLGEGAITVIDEFKDILNFFPPQPST